MKKVKVKYVGTYPIMHQAPGFSGDVLPGEEIEVFESVIHEYKEHPNWELLKEKRNSQKDKDHGGDE